MTEVPQWGGSVKGGVMAVSHFERGYPAPRPVLAMPNLGRHTGAPSSGVAPKTTDELRKDAPGVLPLKMRHHKGEKGSESGFAELGGVLRLRGGVRGCVRGWGAHHWGITQ